MVIIICPRFCSPTERILRLVPKRLTKWQDIIDANVDQIKSEYIFVSKKSVVDFVLGKSLDNSCSNETTTTTTSQSRERHEIKDIGKLHAHV